MDSGFETALSRLDASTRPLVHRFDAGPRFEHRIAVLPSAFNPPTRAHLRLLDIACQVDGVTGVAALLSTHNVDKGVFGASLADRIGMLTALREVHPGLAILASNAARIPDQAVALRMAHPEAAFDFVVGYDTLARIFEGRYYQDMHGDLERFFAHHRLITMNRGEATYDEVCRFLERDTVRGFASRIVACMLEAEPAQLSSTLAREEVMRGDVSRAVPDEVLDYIERRGLYRREEGAGPK